jgi:hypothetical protein
MTIRQLLRFAACLASASAHFRFEFRRLARLLRARLPLPVWLLALTPSLEAQFSYTTNTDNTITITGYTGSFGDVTVPSVINGLPVTDIGDSAFAYYTNLTNVTIPDSVTGIGENAFAGCTGLTSVTIPKGVTTIEAWVFSNCINIATVKIPAGVERIMPWAFADCAGLRSLYFAGNEPIILEAAFAGTTNITIYYLPGTTGWERWLDAVLWNPRIQVGVGDFGVGQTGFGFNVAGTPNVPFAVEASANLSPGVWLPLQTLALTNGLVSFSDPAWTNYPSRFYRLRWP